MWDTPWPIAAVVAAVFAGIAVMARMAGWHALARTLRAQAVPAGESLRFVSGSLGTPTWPIQYKNCLRLVLNDQGFYLSLMFPFKFASPALFVPWQQVESCTVEPLLATQTVVFRFQGQRPLLKLRGSGGQLAREAYQRHAEARCAPAA